MAEGETQVTGTTRTEGQTEPSLLTQQATTPETTPETKPETKTEPSLLTQKEEKTETKVEGAPEKYEDFTVPEGYTLDEGVSKEFTEIAKALNLPQAGAQQLVDFYVSKTQEAFRQPFETYKSMIQGWQNEVKSHAEITAARSSDGKLTGIDQVKAVVSRAIDGIGDPKLASDFRAALDLTGAGNHPAVARVLFRWAQQVTEGGAVRGGGPSPLGQREPGAAPKSQAHALYPNLA